MGSGGGMDACFTLGTVVGNPEPGKMGGALDRGARARCVSYNHRFHLLPNLDTK